MKRTARYYVKLLLLITVILSALAACSPTSTPTTTSPPTLNTPAPTASPSPTTTGQSVSIDLVAQNQRFDKSAITVPAGASVTINFDNRDNGIRHNFAVYTDSGASSAIFVGEMVTGPSTIAYKFTAPSTPGTYFFRCDPHAAIMTGDFIVQ